MSSPQSDRSYPVAETFTSVQGEGVYTGTLMYFIRLAGCNVGRYSAGVIPPELRMFGRDVKAYSEGENASCCTVLGQRFLCDTNYHKQFDMSAAKLLERAGTVEHVCLTGGEPFLHDLFPLIEEAGSREVHVETSGTRPIDTLYAGRVWVTCSPKDGFLAENVPLINEWKFLIGAHIDVDRMIKFITDMHIPDDQEIFLQPINPIDGVSEPSIDLVLAVLEEYPYFRLSAQLHKYLGVR